MSAAAAIGRRDALDASYSPIGGLVSSPEHPDGLPFMVRAADRVRMWNGVRLFEEPKLREDLLRAAAIVQLHATEDDELFPGLLVGLPFEGVTRRRLRLVSETLRGYPVRYWGVYDRTYSRPPEGRLGVFLRVSMPGDWQSDCFGMPYDLRIATSWDERDSGPACGSGTSHVLGLGALARIEVLSMDPWDVCGQCGSWRPRELLRDADAWMLDDRSLHDEYWPRLECASQTEEGYCR